MIDIKFKIQDKDLLNIAKEMEKDLYMEYGYFEDNTLNEPAEGYKSIGKGIKARKVGKSIGGSQIELASELEDKYGFLSKPLKEDSKELKGVLNELISYKIYENKENKNRLLNATKSLILKPILTDKYGRNSKKTEKTKGFNKFLIDTGQTIKRLQVRISKKEIIDDNGKV
jgi:hypothetical protein